MPNGAKLWRLAYRFGGKQKKLAIGPYPAIGLADARAKREAAKALPIAGRDPSIHKQATRAVALEVQGLTFAKVAAELLEKKGREGKAANTLAKLEWLYGVANDQLADRPISEISAAEVLTVLRKAEGKGRLETAKRLRAVIGEVFRYAIATARAVNDPTFALRGAITAPVVKHFHVGPGRTGNLQALCCVCLGTMHKRLSVTRLEELRAVVEVTIRQAPARLGE